VTEQSELSAALKRAIEDESLSLAYQPKIDLGTGRVIGVEALARWRDEVRGDVPPSEFIPLAESGGMIDALTQWVCRRALTQLASWRGQGFSLSIAINVSALTLRDVGLPDSIERLCRLQDIGCDNVTVELTETAAQHDVHLLDTLTRFRIKGFCVALDDFGTGYSSLLQLRQLPFTELKIDRSFIHDVATAEDSRLIVKSVIDLSHALGLIAVAEGVEDEETLRVLAALGCDQVQGFFIARPMPADEVTHWLRQPDQPWQRFRRSESSAAA
jgi:EAL domain-containing protein (putative c-di-GMP-specific phosphodiesterase class I)